MPKAEQFSIRLPGPKRAKIDKLAKEDGRSRAGYIAHVLDRHLEEVGKAA